MQKAYSKIEQGETKVDNQRITDISNIFEVDPMDLLAFDESYVFNNCSQFGKFMQFINQLPEKLIEQYEARIKQLEAENKFLKDIHKSRVAL